MKMDAGDWFGILVQIYQITVHSVISQMAVSLIFTASKTDKPNNIFLMSLMPVELSYHVQDMCVISLHKLKQF
jgi:hypothetical protein